MVAEFILAESPNISIYPADEEYRRRVREEIAHYSFVENVNELPDICYVWLEKYVRPKLQEVFGVTEIVDFYAKYVREFRARQPERKIGIVSLGAGNAEIESAVAKSLLASGAGNFHFLCLDINPEILKRGRESTASQGLAGYFDFLETDIARWRPAQPVDIVMAQHLLHHLVNLEEVLASVKRAIGDEGCFLTADMVGRNGHMRWPEALMIVQDIWRTMPDRYKYNHQLKRFEREYENWDCSKEGFEGVRSQDILPLLVANFHFEAFAAFGNLPDIFIDRGFGHNFDAKNEEDRAFIDRIGVLNDRLIDEGRIKPTQIVAAMKSTTGSPTRCHKYWTPEFCIRKPDCSPSRP